MDLMEPSQLLQVIRHVGPGERGKWTRRTRVLALIGQLPEGVEVSARELERRGCYSRGWACRVLRELVGARVLEPVWRPAGTRGGAYRVNPRVREWDVPWLVDDLRIVEAEVHTPLAAAAPESRPVSRSARPYRDAVRNSVAVNGPPPRHKQGQRRAGGASTATQGNASVAPNGGSARRWDEGGQRSSFLGSVGDSAAASSSVGPEEERLRVTIERAVVKAIGVRFFRGRQREQLVRLAAEHGLEAVMGAIAAHVPSMPRKSDVLRITELVGDVAGALLADHELLEQIVPLEPEAPTPPEVRPGPAPLERYVPPPAEDVAEPGVVSAAIEAARRAVAGTVTTEPGGAKMEPATT